MTFVYDPNSVILLNKDVFDDIKETWQHEEPEVDCVINGINQTAALAAEGNAFLLRRKPRSALVHFTKALEIDAMNRECLVGRSKCYLRLQNTDEALKDAEAALQIEKNSHQAIFQKAEALFCRGDYEHALVYYSRGAKLRKDLDCFRLGIQKSQDAITAAVGANGNASKLTPTKDADCRVRIKKGKQKKTHR